MLVDLCIYSIYQSKERYNKNFEKISFKIVFKGQNIRHFPCKLYGSLFHGFGAHL